MVFSRHTKTTRRAMIDNAVVSLALLAILMLMLRAWEHQLAQAAGLAV